MIVPGTFDPAAHRYAATATLRDGGSIVIRDLRPDDKTRLRAHFDSLSPQSRYFRFLATKKSLSDEELRGFTELDFRSRAALVATLHQGADERIIGVARYAVAPDTPGRAEVGFAVLDEHQGRGIGTVLLEHLAALARVNGVTEFEADVLGENNRMLGVFADSGFAVTRSLEGGVFHLSFPTEATSGYLEVHDRRDRHAAAESIRSVLEPRAVAVVGASREAGTIGAVLVENLVRCGFRGPIYPVNPAAREIAGLAAHPSVGAIGQPVDLAVIAVPASRVEEVVADCARAGVRAVVVISAGFGEVSGAGRDVERRLVALARGSGMRMVGPNCMGVLNTDPAISLNATFAPTWPPQGNIGMFTQSGALGLAILDTMHTLNIGMSSFVAAGNKADVSGNDLLSYWAEDPRTRVIVLYLESFGNPRKFARVAPAVAREKPIVAVKSGRSAAGTRAASSHSAALATPDVAVDALFEQAGVIRTATLEELFDVVALLSTQPVPGGPGVGIVTNGGGPGILLADACAAHGLGVPALADETTVTLRGFLPSAASVGNPVDMIASATPEQFARAIEVVGGDPAVDAVVVIYVPPMVTRPEEVAAAIGRGAGTVPPEKPLLTVFMSARGAPAPLGSGPRGALPSYSFPENAALALAAAERYGRWRRRPAGTSLTLGRFERDAVRAVVERVLEKATGAVWLDPPDLWTMLRAAGIDFAVSEVAAPPDATATAERLGYPLVAKAVAPGLVHKSDVGAVILGLDSAAAVADAVTTLTARLGALDLPLERVLLQRQVTVGIEALVGVTTDPTFGPLVVCGLGGILVELVRDVVHHLTPVTDVDAAEMIGKLRAARLLDGYRGQPPGDRDALALVIQRVSALVEAVPEIRELDLNPVKVLPPCQGAIVVDGRMRIGR
jgi:acetate---CoA ligase (ADP-forming)